MKYFALTLVVILFSFSPLESQQPAPQKNVKKFVWKSTPAKKPVVTKPVSAKPLPSKPIAAKHGFVKSAPSKQTGAQYAAAKPAQRNISKNGKKGVPALPPMIRAELDRSRFEEKAEAQKSAAVKSQTEQSAASSMELWKTTLLYSGALFTFLMLAFVSARWLKSRFEFVSARVNAFFMARRKMRPAAVRQPAPALPDYSALIADDEREEPSTAYDLRQIQSILQEQEDDMELPEAVLTRNILNRKRMARRDTLLHAVNRAQKHESTVNVAKSMKMGVGEIELAMHLMKFRSS